MEFSVKSGNVTTLTADCLVVAVHEGRKLGTWARQIDKTTGGYLDAILRSGDIQGKPGQTLMLHDLPGIACERVLLVGCGDSSIMDDGRYQKIVNAIVPALADKRIGHILFTLGELRVRKRDSHWKLLVAVKCLRNQSYRFDRLKSKQSRRALLKRVSLIVSERSDLAPGRKAINAGQAIADGMDLAKDLGNLPGNICTPTYLASQARQLAREYRHLRTSVLEESDMKKLKMGALMSVARGSQQPAKMIIMKYSGTHTRSAPVVLVGKGITFDSGGISIKPAAAMDEMKYDMCGAASVFGTMKAVAELGLPINLVGIVPSCENLPDGNASKPGDIVTSMSGQTIEILNTDAEGRLILCDALTYAGRFKPDTVIDIATLTGACVIALGKYPSGMLCNHSPLAQELVTAGLDSTDRVWEMPLWEEYQSQLDSNFADMANIGGREAGTITAACFLSRFTKDYHWAHLDIAGTAWLSGSNKGATGRPVPLLTQYLMNKCNA